MQVSANAACFISESSEGSAERQRSAGDDAEKLPLLGLHGAFTETDRKVKFRSSLDRELNELRRNLLREYDRQLGNSIGESKFDAHPKTRTKVHTPPSVPRQPSLSLITPAVAQDIGSKNLSLTSIPETQQGLSVRSTPRIPVASMVVVHADGDATSPRTKHVALRTFETSSSMASSNDSTFEQSRELHTFTRMERPSGISAIPSGNSGEDSTLARWHRICSALLRPRPSDPKQAAYKIHECWLQQLAAYRKNDHNKHMYNAALDKVKSGKRNSLVRAHSSLLTLSSIPTIEHGGGGQSLVIHPSSKARMVWVLLSCLVFLSDTALLPVNAFFDLGESLYIRCALNFGTVFLALDVLANCITGTYVHGVLEMKFDHIVREYAKTWLAFDLTLTAVDWILTIADLISNSLGNVFRSIQVVRILRLVRLVRLEGTLQSSFGLVSRSGLVWCNIFKITFMYATYFHILACVWYGVGNAEGREWVEECSSSSHVNCYFSCFHWALTQIHGTSVIKYTKTVEWAFASLSLLIGFVLFALFLGTIAHAVAMLTNVDKLEVRLRCIRYTEVHQLSSELAHRLLQYVDSSRLQVNLAERIKQEDEVLHNLPVSLQHDLLFEARGPLLQRVSIFQDLVLLSGTLMKNMCCDAVHFSVFMGGEKVFASGEPGTHWRTVDSGGFLYVSAQAIWTDVAKTLFKSKSMRPSASERSNSSSVSARSAGLKKNSSIARGQSISEMLLWTSWEHVGDLSVTSDGVVLELTLKAFHDVLKERFDCASMVAYYAQRYVKHLCSAKGEVTDLYEYSPIDGDEDYDSESHMIFLSHYKAEAGTEATLMQEGLTKLMTRANVECAEPVFLDSEDLTNLSDLRDHVVNSRSLVFILTPGVLLRPWCLVELATAATYGVQIVPVEIQRPGMTFIYPDEFFYFRLRTGKLLPSADAKLLENEGITPDSLESAVRSLFTEIALPFSPHKSKNIREAELNDIMRRCNCHTAASLHESASIETS